MCFGFDGDKALDDSLAAKGASRRALFRGAAVGAAGLAVASVGTGAATAAPGRPGKPGKPGKPVKGQRRVPHRAISLQMYTLRAAVSGEPGLETVLDRLAQYGYQQVELAGYYGRTAAEMKTLLDERGLKATSSHDGISATRAEARTKMENAALLGQSYVNVPYLNSDSLEEWQGWADAMNAEARIARRFGLRYGYHNHAHEFTIDLGGGVTPWQVLTERLDPKLVHLEADLYWVYTGGVNTNQADPDKFVIDTLRAAPQEVRQFHVKDRDAATGDMADLGTGVVDFERIFSKHRAEQYIVENDNPDVSPLTSAAVGHLYLEHVRY
ncbi:Inosose dehydratase [Nocardioides aquaticus]|uniref:Inosose dehydratase n=1 Tax=Nocardioides aquaticus TaxID=160826 RepID=A0ABX8ELW9_9ACTN|nr:sugar phosphate isomerase/epimerase [Nocardioides aquaticus]QVT81525.1 Inosose dehydratase [Nocardioides aquaticus]